MNRLEIFQKVYGTDHVFTAQELERLGQVAELIVKECADFIECGEFGDKGMANELKKYFEVKE
jgi:hypothetical protein